MFRPLLASPNLGEEPELAAILISLNVFHCPHEGHLPTHFGDSWPQLVQTYAVLSFAIMIAKVRKAIIIAYGLYGFYEFLSIRNKIIHIIRTFLRKK